MVARRRGDGSRNDYLELDVDSNGDVFVRVGGSSKGDDIDGPTPPECQVEFCVPRGGGYHPYTIPALYRLAKAIEKDNNDPNSPSRYSAEFVGDCQTAGNWRAPEKTRANEFRPSNFVVFVPRGDKMIPLRIGIVQGGIVFSAEPDKGEEDEEEALRLIAEFRQELLNEGGATIEDYTRHQRDIGAHRIDRIKVTIVPV